MYNFSVDYRAFDTNNIINIDKYLMKKHIKTYKKTCKIILGIIKNIFIVLLCSVVDASNHTKRVLLSNQKCMTQPTLINLYSKEYSQEFHFFPFLVKLDRCVGSFNTLTDLSHKVFVPNKIGDLNLIVFNMITGINQSKTLTKN